VLDSDVLSAAPPRMTRAGFGDLCSKPVSGADWTLSHWLGFDPICPTAMALADDAVAAARAKAGAIGCSEAEAVSTLGAALVLSGFAMDLAGMSSPASGGEHLISHYLDISADGWGRKPWLHGEQVAVGTALSLALYERIRSCGAPDRSTAPLDEDDEPTLRACHSHLDPEALSELIGQAQRKRSRQPDRAARRSRYASEWPALWNRLDTQLGSAAGLIADLRAAGVPTRFDQIDVPLDRARHVARTARHMRDRYTVLDWAADLGLALDEGIA
jgi:glycerol-1-phosphate dehydrogenase [NAD(P)+]